MMVPKVVKEKMKISQTGISNKGFTFIELLLVIFIISLTISLILPSLKFFESTYKSDAKRFASIIRYLNDSAINRKETYEMKLDLDNKRINWTSPDGGKEAELSSLSSLYLSSKGILDEGELKLFFGALGFEESLKAYFSTEEDTLIVSYNPYSKRVKIERENPDI